MDLEAYVNIGTLDSILARNNIYVPRLRGLRLMSEEKPYTVKEIEEEAKVIGLINCENLCCSNFKASNFRVFSKRTRRIQKKLLIYDGFAPIGIRWRNLHGKKRKIFRWCLRKTKKRVEKQIGVFNKYCGRNDILYIHARIGGNNWEFFGGPELEKQPWFVERADDAFDCTYCDIYAKIK